MPNISNPQTEPAVIETMSWDRDTKRTRRFSAESDAPRLSDVYVSRHAPGIEHARRIEVTIRILE